MNFGVPKEVREQENRVGLTPAGVHALAEAGHAVFVEHHAGIGAGFTDENFRAQGGVIVYSADEVYGRAQVITKVTRLTANEHALLREGQTILSFMHLAVSSPDLLQALHSKSITAIAYEMIEARDGSHPVLLTSSQVAGRMAPIIAGELMSSTEGGRGILISGIAGVPPAAVVIVGAGTLGESAARAFFGMGAQVTVLDRSPEKLQRIEEIFRGRITTLFSTAYNLHRVVEFADVLIGAILMPGQRAPILVTREMVKKMRARSVILDLSIDQGGCVETSRPTTHRNPTFIEEGVIHYCVPTILSRVARTASHALLNASLPFLYEIGQVGVEEAVRRNPALKRGVNTWQGKLVNPQIGEALGLPTEAMR